MTLDMRTAVLATALVYGTIAIVSLLLSRRGTRPFPGERLWAFGYLSIFVSQSAICLRGIIPDWLSILMGNVLTAVALCGTGMGTELFFGLRPMYGAYSAAVGACAFSAVYFGLVVPDARARVVILSVAGAAVLGAIMIRLRPFAAGSGGRNARSLQWSFGILALILLARLPTVGMVDRADWLRSAWTDPLFVMLLSCGFMALAFFLRRLVAARLRADLDKALSERELLIREMHHRTKNELALVQSLLRLEFADVEAGSATAEKLEAVGSRLQSIGISHDLLHRLGAVRAVRLDEYLGLIAESLSGGGSRWTISTSLEPVEMDSKRAVSVGLIVNELGLNALRHAFPDGRKGRIGIRLSLDGEGQVRVDVEDDGVGQARNPGPEGFGSLMVRTLVNDLGGTMTIEDGGGTSVSLRVPIEDDEASPPPDRQGQPGPRGPRSSP